MIIDTNRLLPAPDPNHWMPIHTTLGTVELPENFPKSPDFYSKSLMEDGRIVHLCTIYVPKLAFPLGAVAPMGSPQPTGKMVPIDINVDVDFAVLLIKGTAPPGAFEMMVNMLPIHKDDRGFVKEAIEHQLEHIRQEYPNLFDIRNE